MTVDNPNVGLAFLMVSCAGMATALGAAVVFSPKLVKLASRKVLAGALGLSAGVMMYVSFVEIFVKSLDAFEKSGLEPKVANTYATLCFFGGMVFMICLHHIVHYFAGDHDSGHAHIELSGHNHEVSNDIRIEECKHENKEDSTVKPQYCVGCSDDPKQDLEDWQHMAAEEERRNKDEELNTGAGTLMSASVESGNADHITDNDRKIPGSSDSSVGKAASAKGDMSSVADSETADKVLVDTTAMEAERKQLARMGLHTALAIGLHNFPEGLATFVATLDDPKVGGVLAVAIGIHNIPEGLCVALPIYYATGDRKKAFLWALLSGLSEPLAALLGWLVLANSFSSTTYAIMFGVVAGMMVYISNKELLPTAHRYDPEDSVVTYSWMFGMGVMALSLVLFQL
eukprot:CAMPEP_0197824966 /NCGR_PEP_ID=MMETSP1437-20131217/2131_1 /TAXON_ID=49252 ORGANISM="Eucampia antarctica, Strain CCMP1452" /NCGR_SAMPLE_ID=MMETSP1437 /ASSEMBLY_ACC=CAM_ASM_001096 /LENGTH=399 /DNA_ID=CAMNT_0043424787 /DNA_START=168 /DNA_END=1367 /DNA_ORIENTATION=-